MTVCMHKYTRAFANVCEANMSPSSLSSLPYRTTQYAKQRDTWLASLTEDQRLAFQRRERLSKRRKIRVSGADGCPSNRWADMYSPLYLIHYFLPASFSLPLLSASSLCFNFLISSSPVVSLLSPPLSSLSSLSLSCHSSCRTGYVNLKSLLPTEYAMGTLVKPPSSLSLLRPLIDKLSLSISHPLSFSLFHVPSQDFS